MTTGDGAYVDKCLCRGATGLMALTEIPDFPIPDQFGRIRELRVAREPMRLALNALSVSRQQRGEGRHVLVLPGFGTNDSSTLLLRSYLRSLGYKVTGLGARRTSTSLGKQSPLRDTIEKQILERSSRPITRPITSIYSRHDGVVSWQACVDPDPAIDNVEVQSSHCGLGIDPDVLKVVAKAIHRAER